jgi:putative transposase
VDQPQTFAPVRFEWQQSYAAFSYSKNKVARVATYIENQQEHHKKESFLDEYRRMLTSFEIDYDERYIFKDLI